MIIANHLLYHLDKDSRAGFYREVQKRLKPGGHFCCSLIGREHMRELHTFVKQYNPEIEIPMEKFDIWLETAEMELGKWFSEIEVTEQENDLMVPEAEAVYQYVASYSEQAKMILEKDKENFLARIDAIIKQEGSMYIHKSAGVVICTYE